MHIKTGIEHTRPPGSIMYSEGTSQSDESPAKNTRGAVSNQPPNLLNIPQELRDEILGYALTEKGESHLSGININSAKSGEWNWITPIRRSFLALSLTCQQLYKEAAAIFWAQKNSFRAPLSNRDLRFFTKHHSDKRMLSTSSTWGRLGLALRPRALSLSRFNASSILVRGDARFIRIWHGPPKARERPNWLFPAYRVSLFRSLSLLVDSQGIA